MPAKPKKRAMSNAHKQALAAGRTQARAVRDYLEILETQRPKRGRKRTPDSVKKRLAAIATASQDATALQRLAMAQERRDLEVELATFGAKVDLAAYEKGFVKNAKGYAEAKGLSYAAFREVGVPAEVLKKAGVSRGA